MGAVNEVTDATFDDVVRTGHLLAGDLSAEVSA